MMKRRRGIQGEQHWFTHSGDDSPLLQMAHVAHVYLFKRRDVSGFDIVATAIDVTGSRCRCCLW